MNLKGFLLELLTIVLIALTIFLLVQFFFIGRAVVVGSSMEPNLHNDEKILINKVAYLGSGPERGDVIIFKPPENYPQDKDLIKRVIGLPGEIAEMKDGIVYIHQADGNVFALDERGYIKQPSLGYYISQVIPPDNYFVLGDNRKGSSDSRVGWTVPREDIDGKAWFIIWPFSEFGSVLNYSLP